MLRLLLKIKKMNFTKILQAFCCVLVVFYRLLTMASTMILLSHCRMNPNDHKTLAQLIAAYSKFDANKAKMYPYKIGQNKYLSMTM